MQSVTKPGDLSSYAASELCVACCETKPEIMIDKCGYVNTCSILIYTDIRNQEILKRKAARMPVNAFKLRH